MVAWDKICCSKKYGGLGLRKTGVVNTAFMAKLAWKFLTQSNNYWVQQMRAKYGRPTSFFQYKKKQANSWVWKCMLRTREFVKRSIQWKLGNGHTISFWLDNWCHGSSLVELLAPGPSAHDISQVKVGEFITFAKL